MNFWYGLYFPSNKLNVTSKTLSICKFVFILILKPEFLNVSIMSFCIRSVFCLDVFLKSTSPSSLYKPVDYCLSSLFDNEDNIWMPTSSQISAPSKLLMGTSKQLSVFFYFQGSLLLNNKDFLQCCFIRKSFSGILMYYWANRIAWSYISSDIDG